MFAQLMRVAVEGMLKARLTWTVGITDPRSNSGLKVVDATEKQAQALARSEPRLRDFIVRGRFSTRIPPLRGQVPIHHSTTHEQSIQPGVDAMSSNATFKIPSIANEPLVGHFHTM